MKRDKTTDKATERGVRREREREVRVCIVCIHAT